MFLGVGTNLGKEFLEKFVNNTPTIEKVITILSLNNCEFNFNRKIELIVLDFGKINLGNYPNLEILNSPIDGEILSSFSKYYVEIMKIMDRADMYKFFTYQSRFDLFITHLEFWNSIIDQKEVDLVISTDMPHEAQDYIAYRLCEMKKINRCFLVQSQIYQFYQLFDDIDSNDHYLSNYDIEENAEFISNPIIQEYYQKQMCPDFVPFYMENISKKTNFFYNISIKFSDIINLIITNKLLKPFNLIEYFYLREIFGSVANKRLKTFYDGISVIPNYDLPYIYFPLHFQPERTTSPQGGIYSNQEIVVKMLSYFAPPNWVVYLKEHPMQTNNSRSISYYEKLSNLPNVKFVDRSTNSLKLVLNSRAVASITGTAAWEAFCYKKPVILFGNIFFKYAKGVFNVKSNLDLKEAFDIIVEGNLNLDDSNVIKFINYFAKRIHHGAIDEVYFPTAEIDWNLNMENLIFNIDKYLNDQIL